MSMRPLVDDPDEYTDISTMTHELCGTTYEICQRCFQEDRRIVPCPHCVEETPEP